MKVTYTRCHGDSGTFVQFCDGIFGMSVICIRVACVKPAQRDYLVDDRIHDVGPYISE